MREFGYRHEGKYYKYRGLVLMIDPNAFDIVDAAMLGGLVGFIEESVLSEVDLDDDTLTEKVEEYVDISSNKTIRLLYNQNPGLVKYLIHEAYKSRNQISKAQQEEIDAVYMEMYEEIEYLKHIDDGNK